jgi:DNA primase
MYLYGYHLAKMDISALDEVVVVEGQFDVTCLHSYNIRNVVGICGSAFNLIQLALLARICSTVYFVMDPDNSGKKTVDRAKDLYKSNYMIYRNMKFHYVDLPENLDPDDFVIKNGAEEFKKLLKESRK